MIFTKCLATTLEEFGIKIADTDRLRSVPARVLSLTAVIAKFILHWRFHGLQIKVLRFPQLWKGRGSLFPDFANWWKWP